MDTFNLVCKPEPQTLALETRQHFLRHIHGRDADALAREVNGIFAGTAAKASPTAASMMGAALPDVEEFKSAELLKMEKELLGFYITSHPLTEHQTTLERYSSATTREALQLSEGVEVTIGGMISRLRGKPVARTGDKLVLEVGGVGYAVAVTPTASRLAERGGEVTLETYLHVREDALQLYGFAEPAERELFEHLLAVSGVGPKVALAIVSGSPPADLRRAIALEDTARFEAIPGIGKKTAQRVVLELKEKLGSVAAAPPEKGHVGARDALVELGYSLAEAEEALAGTDPEAPPEERVREALKKAA